MRMKAYVYILGANKNLKGITGVPWEIDEKEIFFGPCKKRLRQYFRQFLDEDRYFSNEFKDEYFLIGLNRLSRDRKRKIIWTGKLATVMTFAYAYEHLKGARYLKMRNSKDSPIHVKPIKEGRKLIGYESLNTMHRKNKKWISDLVSNQDSKKIKVKGNKIITNIGYTPFSAFNRDACLLFENIFFTNGKGIDIDKSILKIFQKSQKNIAIDAVAIFGKDKNGHPNGMRGSWFELDDQATKTIIALIKKKAETIKKKKNLSHKETRYRTIKNNRVGCK